MRNEIVWRYRKLVQRIDAKRWGKTSSRILFYAASDELVFEQLHRPLTDDQRKLFRKVDPETGRRYRLDSLLAPSTTNVHNEFEFMGYIRRWRFSEERMRQLLSEGRIEQSHHTSIPRLKRYLDEAKGGLVGDIWDDLPLLPRSSRDQLDMPSILPSEMAVRMLEASTHVGETVLDPFVRSGSLVVEAEVMKRQWIGIDENPASAAMVKYLLASRFSPKPPPSVDVHPWPTTLSEANALAVSSSKMFESWVMGMLGARPIMQFPEQHVDGLIDVFDDPASSQPTRFLVQAKAGQLALDDLDRILNQCEVLGAVAAIVITSAELPPRTKALVEEAGVYGSPSGTIHPRLQSMTISSLLQGERPDLPSAPHFAERTSINGDDDDGKPNF